MAAERKLLVGPDPDGSTFAAGFRAAAKLPTEKQTKQAMEQTFRDMIAQDLHRDALPAGVPTPTSPSFRNTTGWQNDVPIEAPPGLKIIDAMLPVENERRSEARKLLERLLKSAPNDPRVLAAQEALREEKEDGGA